MIRERCFIMRKKLIPAFMAVLIAALTVFPAFSANAETALRKGDTVKYTFTVGECPNVAGISVESYYDPEYLTLSEDPEFLISGQGMLNTNLTGKLRWNTMISGGRAFSDEDILVETFTVNRACTLDDVGLSFECLEIFDHDTMLLSGDLISARVDILETGTDEPETDSEEETIVTDTDDPENTETDNAGNTDVSQKDTDSGNASNTSIKPINVTSTDLTGSDEDIDPKTGNTTSRNTNSRKPSAPANTSSVQSQKNTSSKTESARTASSEKTSSAASSQKTSSAVSSNAASSVAASSAVSSKSAVSATSPKTSTTSVSSVSTAGRIAISLIIAVLAAAGVTVFLVKKLKASDE